METKEKNSYLKMLQSSEAQMSLSEAESKKSNESFQSIKHFRMKDNGDYQVRILPIVPDVDGEGNFVFPMKHKGYDYPLRDIVLNIMTGKVDKKGKDILKYVSVPHIKQIYPSVPADLIDVYSKIAADKYADDADFVKQVQSTSFMGGLKYNSSRCMYIYDLDKKSDGIQIMALSYSQYRDLDDLNIKIWQKLAKKDPSAESPIASILNAYPVGITKANDNGKTKYKFDISILDGICPLEDNEINDLVSMKRIPDVIYKYTRFHLEATIAFLTQYDYENDVHIMDEPEIKDCIEAISMCLPADDNSHFTLDGNSSEEESKTSLEELWKAQEQLDADGKDAKSEEALSLRANILQFIEDNGLDVEVTRRDKNGDILDKVDAALKAKQAKSKVSKPEDKDDDGEDEEKEEKKPRHEPESEESEEEKEDKPEPEDDPEDKEEEEDEEEEAPKRPKRAFHAR